MLDTDGKVKTNSLVTFSNGPLHTNIASVGQPARSYRQQLCTETRCSLEDMPEVMDGRDKCRESQGNLH